MTETQSQQPSAKPGVPSASDFTSSPLRNRIRVELDAPVSEVWELVGDLSRFPEYSVGLERVEAVQHLTQAVLQASGGQLRDDATALCLDWHGGPPRDRDATSLREQTAKGDSIKQRRPEPRRRPPMFCAYGGWRRRPWISAWLSIVASSSSRATTTTLFQTPG